MTSLKMLLGPERHLLEPGGDKRAACVVRCVAVFCYPYAKDNAALAEFLVIATILIRLIQSTQEKIDSRAAKTSSTDICVTSRGIFFGDRNSGGVRAGP